MPSLCINAHVPRNCSGICSWLTNPAEERAEIGELHNKHGYARDKMAMVVAATTTHPRRELGWPCISFLLLPRSVLQLEGTGPATLSRNTRGIWPGLLVRKSLRIQEGENLIARFKMKLRHERFGRSAVHLRQRSQDIQERAHTATFGIEGIC